MLDLLALKAKYGKMKKHGLNTGPFVINMVNAKMILCTTNHGLLFYKIMHYV